MKPAWPRAAARPDGIASQARPACRLRELHR
jgi:hypothetical protein